jgi:hypothetical protein
MLLELSLMYMSLAPGREWLVRCTARAITRFPATDREGGSSWIAAQSRSGRNIAVNWVAAEGVRGPRQKGDSNRQQPGELDRLCGVAGWR